MYGAPKISFNYGNENIADSPEAKQIFEDLNEKVEDNSIKVKDYMEVKPYDLLNVQRPSFFQNMNYFITFQNSYYFIRYLLL